MPSDRAPPARTYGPEGSVQLRSTATTALSNTFGFIQMPPANVNKATNGYCAEFGRKRILRGPDPGPIPPSALSSNASDWSAKSPQNAVLGVRNAQHDREIPASQECISASRSSTRWPS